LVTTPGSEPKVLLFLNLMRFLKSLLNPPSKYTILQNCICSETRRNETRGKTEIVGGGIIANEVAKRPSRQHPYSHPYPQRSKPCYPPYVGVASNSFPSIITTSDCTAQFIRINVVKIFSVDPTGNLFHRKICQNECTRSVGKIKSSRKKIDFRLE